MEGAPDSGSISVKASIRPLGCHDPGVCIAIGARQTLGFTDAVDALPIEVADSAVTT